ncbi:alpha/beta hydrolase [Actinoplanes sp. LDG1-06]|uniref:Alpha/beta hydrolase n=1 Tax=Paractinoplanes ovalisporus TaxID=2810368 RepID=A0ABS2AFM1_9ACTN|nr:alpha/beta hydrolase [Actinoplanes ovalisporus]MBM2618610.1 alpha/beta hydrolase [Actinoplanes ovalisporus]
MTHQPPRGRLGPLFHTLAGSGRPVLLLHGLGGDRTQALGLLPSTFEATRIAPDLPGHGDTDLTPDEPVTFAAFAERVAGLLTSPVPVVGVSMGAGVAQALAAAHPELVERLVLVRPSWLDEPPAHLEVFRTIARLLPDRDAFLRTDSYQRIAAEAPAMAQSLLGQFDRPYAVERARVLDQMPLSFPYGETGVDLTIVAAPGDPVHPESLARELHRRNPGSRLIMVPPKLPDPTEHQDAVRAVVAKALAG